MIYFNNNVILCQRDALYFCKVNKISSKQSDNYRIYVYCDISTHKKRDYMKWLR